MHKRIAAGLGMALALAACGKKQEAPPPPPPPLVDAVVVQPRSVANMVELPGRIEAVRTAEVRARTDGIVERQLYQEGTDVRAGQPLFRIDQRDYRAQVQSARAAVARALAAQANAAAIVKRYRPLVSERAVSAQEFDTALANLRTADANVADARATLTRANLQLSYTIVRAPISGRVGRAEVTEGALVSAASATLMTRVDQATPVYATFAQPNADTLELIREQRMGTVSVPPLRSVPVQLVLENGVPYRIPGRLDFAAQIVEPTTGSQTLRAQVPNPERILLPGQFVRGRIALGQVNNALSVPQRAVQLNGDKASVTVVAPNGTAGPRPVQLGTLSNGQWVIRSGLKAGERVITDGWQKVMQPGTKVQVKQPGQRGQPAGGGNAAGQGQPAPGAKPGQPGGDPAQGGQAQSKAS